MTICAKAELSHIYISKLNYVHFRILWIRIPPFLGAYFLRSSTDLRKFFSWAIKQVLFYPAHVPVLPIIGYRAQSGSILRALTDVKWTAESGDTLAVVLPGVVFKCKKVNILINIFYYMFKIQITLSGLNSSTHLEIVELSIKVCKHLFLKLGSTNYRFSLV
jgi:hypothetical protein